jgi:hypothetical protein
MGKSRPVAVHLGVLGLPLVGVVGEVPQKTRDTMGNPFSFYLG